MTAITENRFEDILFTVSQMTVAEAQEFKSKVAERMGVSFPSQIKTSSHIAEVIEEEKQTQFQIVMEYAGTTKMQVLKTVRELFGYTLQQSKEVVDSLPHQFEGGPFETVKAEDIKAKLTAAGAAVKLI